MKITIDITSLAQKGTGIKEYTLNIVKNLLKIDNENEYVLYSWEKIDNDVISQISCYKNYRLRIINIPSFLFFLRDKIKFLFSGIIMPYTDIFFSPDFALPLFLKAKNKFIIIHDLSFIIYPQFFNKKTNIFFKKVRYSFKAADKVIAVSLNTKKDIIRYLGTDEKKIKVISEGVSKNFSFIPDNEKTTFLKAKYNLNYYILSVGTLQPRKNFIKLIEAFNVIKDDYPELSLVIAGNKGWLYKEIFKKVSDLQLNKRVIFTGFILPEDLPSLYRGAKAFIFPSFYEGFGIPILEAFACDVPVLLSNTSSMPEVAGSAALYFNPNSAADLAQKIKMVLSDKKLNEDLIKKGQDRLKKFSWEDSACQILELFKNADRN